MMKNVFITGVTGFLGGELLVELSKRKDIGKLYCLIRAESEAAADSRLQNIFNFHKDYLNSDKIIPVLGDLTENDLVSRLIADKRLSDTNLILHAAANTSFSPIYDTMVEQVNIHGLENILKWSETLKNLETFLYVGTATICGKEITNRLIKEEESPDLKAKHLVKYTYTKMMGELLIEKYLPKDKTLIVRPSIIMGDSREWVPRSYVIMWALASINFLRLVPVNSNADLDVIPVDYASNAIIQLLFGKRKHGVYHVSAGVESSTTLLKLTHAIESYFPDKPKFNFIEREMTREVKLWSRNKLNGNNTLKNYTEYLSYWNREMKDAGELRILLGGLDPYLSFIELGQIFDNTKLLEDTNIGLPEPAHEYIKRSVQFIGDIDIFEAALEP
jgi:thioester reductase-like protein